MNKPIFGTFCSPIRAGVRRILSAFLFLLIAGSFVFRPLAAEEAGDAGFFHSNQIVRVEITMAPSDWDQLRQQVRDIDAEFSPDRLKQTVEKPYTWFRASVVVNGREFKEVGVRKRGFFGSADSDRPALNIDLEKFVKGQKISGRTSLKLHNNKQDSSNLRQALSYHVFSKAGVPAPRCNLAHVKVNGKNLGVYSNIEGIDEAFLKRVFGNDKGNLYEAQISDFRPGWTQTFEKKNNPSNTNRAELEAVVRALESDEAHLVENLGKVLDLDAFIDFWAMESLLNHWDGFNGNLNNSFVYQDPKSGKLRFIAWGADSTFGPHHVFVPFRPSASVWAVSYLGRRLYNHPVTGEKYRQRMKHLLGAVWKESELLSEVDRLEQMAKTARGSTSRRVRPEADQIRKFISGRKADVESELSKQVSWSYPMRRELYSTKVGHISADFSTAWQPNAFMNAPSKAAAKIKLSFYGRELTADFTEVKAGPDPGNPENAVLSLSGKFPGIETPVSLWLSISTNEFKAGKSVQASKKNSMLLVSGDWGSPDWRWLGAWGGGTVRLDAASLNDGEKIEGKIDTEISFIPWEDFDLSKFGKSP